ncbi:MAG: alpha/beta fold hydrolase [Pyrinomonadaceae bacterium]
MKFKSILVLLAAAFFISCEQAKAPIGNGPAKPGQSAEQGEQNTGKSPDVATLRFVSSGNVTIVGSYYDSGKPDSPALLLLHQFGSDRHSYDDFAAMMQKEGFCVLSIDGRGFGESIKTTDGRTVSAERTVDGVEAMKTDVDNAFLLLGEQKSVDKKRIGIVGASYGSSLALIYGAENKDVASVALLSPGINYFGSLPTEPAAAAFGDRPLLMVAAKDDAESAEAVATLEKKNAGKGVKTRVYDTGGHGTGIFQKQKDLMDVLKGFLTESLSKK